MNITLFEEVIYKYKHPPSSQFVVVAVERAGMKLWVNSQEINWIKQKESTENGS